MHNEVKQLASVLLDDVERIVERSVARMQELLPSYAKVPAEALVPVTLTNIRNVLEAVRDPQSDAMRSEDQFRILVDTRVRQGITADDLLQAWRIGLDVVRAEAHPVADRLGFGHDVLLEFVEVSLQWGDIGMRRSASAHHESEIRELERLAAEQAALRRVATLVAGEASQAEVFAAIAQEVGQLLGTEEVRMLRYDTGQTVVVVGSSGSDQAFALHSRIRLDGDTAATRVLRTGRTSRLDHYQAVSGPLADTARSIGVSSAVGAPVLVEGRLWGAIVAGSSRGEPLPPETESRLGEFTELMATAVANAEARGQVERLAQEQAALQRVATLVAKEAAPAEVFAKVTEEAAHVIGDVDCVLWREVGDGTITTIAAWGDGVVGTIRIGERFSADGTSAVARVLAEGRPCRIEDYSTTTGPIAERGKAHGIRSAAGCPIVVGGRVWGVIAVARYDAVPLPLECEQRIAQFAELAATALANAAARRELERLAEEQAALRRVATLVAEGASPGAILDAVTGEMEALLDADQVTLSRFEPGEEILVLAHRGLDVERMPVGSRVSSAGENVTAAVRRTGRPARMENYEEADGALAELARARGLRFSVSAPIAVEGKVWGLITASWKGNQSPPADTEERMLRFAQLLATATANADSGAALRRLAAEQAALRRVATLVAEGAPPSAVLDAVAAEMEQVLGADGVTLSRYEPDEQVTVLAHSGSDPRRVLAGTRLGHRGENVTSRVRRGERSARMEHPGGATGAITDLVRRVGVRASLGAPIIVEGRLWGVALATWRGEESPPADTEERMAKFAELLETAIANADSRDQLTASRARLVTEADEARRRVVRDLHDGAQQRLVHTIVTLKLAQRALRGDDEKARSLVTEALEQAQQGNRELRELAHGLLPAVLTQGGLRAGVRAVVARLDLPVAVDVPADRFPAEIEASAYFVVAEALTNVVKHSRANSAAVRAFVKGGMLRVEVRDDGLGRADPNGHGLVGLGDRVTALGGQLTVESPAGGGTVLAATLPFAAT